MIAHSTKQLFFTLNCKHGPCYFIYIQQKKGKYNINIKKSMQKFITGQAIHPRRETIAKRGLKSMQVQLYSMYRTKFPGTTHFHLNIELLETNVSYQLLAIHNVHLIVITRVILKNTKKLATKKNSISTYVVFTLPQQRSKVRQRRALILVFSIHRGKLTELRVKKKGKNH